MIIVEKQAVQLNNRQKGAMNIYNLVEALHERSQNALAIEEKFLAGYLQFFIMVMVYNHHLKWRNDASRVRDTLPQFLHDAFQTLAVPSEQRQEEEREVFEKFQNRYAAIFGISPPDPDASLNSGENGSNALRRATEIAKNLFAEIFNAESAENEENRARARRCPYEGALTSAKFS